MSHNHAVISEARASKAFDAPADVCALLQSIGTPRTVPPKTVLFRKGDSPKGVFVVLNGKVALTAGDHSSALTRIAGRRSLLGLPSTVGNKRYSLTAQALTDVEVCLVHPKEFRSLLTSNPMIGMAIVRILSKEVSALRRLRLVGQ